MAIDPDKLLEQNLELIQSFLTRAQENPLWVMEPKGMETVLKSADFLRRLNADLKKTIDIDELHKLSDEDLDNLEREASEH